MPAERRADDDHRDNGQSVKSADPEREERARNKHKGGGREEARHHQSGKPGQSTEAPEPFQQDVCHAALYTG